MPSLPLTSTLVELTEHVRDWKPADLRVDRERRLVQNVALTALESRNGYRYAEEALREALPLYGGKPVFLDHATNVSRPYDRSARDLVGSIEGPRFEQGRVRGDIRVLDTDAGRTFLGLVESGSPAVGMSHVVLAERDGESRTVERIHDVISVDAVMFPATAATFRESASGAADEHSPAALTAADAVAAGATGATRESADGTGALSASAEGVSSRDAGTDGPPAEPAARDGEMAERCASEAAELVCERGVVAAERDELAREVEQLRQECDQLRAERDREQREREIDRLLAESNLPPAVITEVFRRQLRTESDQAAREALVAERQGLVRQLTARRPHSRERPDDAGAVSDAAFVGAVRRRS